MTETEDQLVAAEGEKEGTLEGEGQTQATVEKEDQSSNTYADSLNEKSEKQKEDIEEDPVALHEIISEKD